MVVDVAETVVAAVAGPVAEAVPVIAARVPPSVAAELGRLGSQGAPPAAKALGASGPAGLAILTGLTGLTDAEPEEPGVLGALRGLGPLLPERLLGALELTVPELGLAGLAGLPASLGEPSTGLLAVAHIGPENHAVAAVTTLEQLRPGAAGFAAALAGRLAAHPRVAPLLSVAADLTGEGPIAAAHGAAYLAVAVAAAGAVLGDWQDPVSGCGPAAAVVGVGAGAAALLLREAPMPPGYAAALLARVRAEYLLPRSASGTVQVTGHRFALAEGDVPEVAGFSGNGLVTVVPGGAVIRTGIAEGSVPVQLTVLAEPPEPPERWWDEVVEVSWRAAAGLASVTGLDEPGDPVLHRETPPWPGDYRLRVHARGRDEASEGDESYELVVWQAPAAPEIVHQRTDRLGHRLRGEPEPDRPDRPERSYRWVEDSALSEAATVTVVTGATVDEVLRAFGADPARPESLRELEAEETEYTLVARVAVLATGAAVVAVEYNGWAGSLEPVLGRASAGGRAASMFWNVNAVTQLSFAEDGQVLASFEPLLDPPEEAVAVPDVAAALAGLDFEDPWDTAAKGLVAVERFTGRGITAADLERIEAADVAFRIPEDVT